MIKRIFTCIGVLALLFLSGCTKNNTIQLISENELFTLDYGNFAEQMSVTDLNQVGSLRFGIAMRDGFFYIADGYSKKIMELNSYGDMLSLFYN